MSGYLALGDLIEARLRASLAPDWPALAVLGARDLAGVRVSGERLPAVHVLYAGDQVLAQDEGTPQTLLEVDQQWMVVVCVADTRASTDAHGELGSLLEAVLLLLQGWCPGTGSHGELRRVQAQAPIYSGGVMRVPLMFRSRTFSVGERRTGPCL